MSDLMSYPGAAGLMASDPGEISSLAGMFAIVASQAENAGSGLKGAQGDAQWTGQAADAFRQQLGKLPGDLTNVQHSYGDVAKALNLYEGQMAPLKSRFQQVLSRLDSLEGSLSSAQGGLSTAQGNLSTAKSAPGAKPTSASVVNANDAVSSAKAAVGQLQGEIAGLERQGRAILDEFNNVRGQARSSVSNAGNSAPVHHWWQSVFSAVGNFVKGLAVGIGKSVWDLVSGKAIIAFIEHPGWATLGALVKDIAVTASLVAMIVAPFAAPELLEADGAALAGEDAATDAAGDALGDAESGAADDSVDGGANTPTSESKSFGDYMRGTNTWGSRVALGANGASAIIDGGSGHWGAAGLDVAFMVAPSAIGGLPKGIDGVPGFGDDVANALHLGDSGADAAADTVKELTASTDSMSLYHELRSFDVNPTLAAKISFTDGVPSALKDVNLDDPSAIKTAVSNANSAAASAAAKAMHLGKPLAYGVDGLVVDPTHDAINHHYHLVPDGG